MAEFLDAKWVVTTLIAIYAAIVATFNVFFIDWWRHRPRIGLVLYKSVQTGGQAPLELLSVNVSNRGYQPRNVHENVSFEIRELLKRGKGTAYLITQPTYLRRAGLMQPTESFIASFPRQLPQEAALEGKLTGKYHVRVFVQDGTNRRFDSNWVELETAD